MEGLSGQVAVVTGASRGIGRAIALELAKRGADVVVNYSGNQALADETVKICEEAGVKAIAVKANVAKLDECQAMIDEAVKEFGKVDILVNNAGVTKDKLIMAMSEQDFDDVISVNLKGAFNCMKLVTKMMMKQRYGRIINMSSVVGIHGNIGQANYSASKGGIIALTKSLAKELASRNILVNAIAPGFIDTDMTNVLGDSTREAILKQIPLAKMGDIEDIANLVVFLSSDKAKYITGQVIGVDGGMGI